MGTSTYRTYGIVIAVTLFVLLAGCAGPFQSGSASDQTDPTDTVTEQTVTETATPEATDAETESASDESDSAAGADGTISGRLLLLVDGADTHLNASTTSESDGVWINESERHRWHVENDSTTLADALSALDVDATSDSLTYANETYDEETNGTTVAYRVDGDVVDDPDAYRLEDGDEVHVTVYTSNRTTPGREYTSSHPHSHGSLTATIDGEEVNFSRDRFTMNDDYFHFHGDEDGARWHAHSTNLTVSDAISAFDDFDVTNESVTYNGTSYAGNRTTISVNDEPVDPERYVIKDGDDIEIHVNESE